MKKTLIWTAMVAVLVSACAAGADTNVDHLGGEAFAPTTTVVEVTDGEQGGDLGVPAISDRKVIYDSRMQLEAASTRDAYERITVLVQSAGGFVASATVEETEAAEDQPNISLVLRLPADQLSATLGQIRDLADRVVTESVSTQDVTDQFVDIEAQLRNLNALETELLALLAELRDNDGADPAKLLQVFDQIRQTRGEIEQLEGRKQLLENLVSLATLEIGISPLPAAAPIVPEPAWEPATVAKEALRDTVTALQGLGELVIRFGLNVVPLLVITVGPMALVGWFLYRRFQRRPEVATPST